MNICMHVYMQCYACMYIMYVVGLFAWLVRPTELHLGIPRGDESTLSKRSKKRCDLATVKKDIFVVGNMSIFINPDRLKNV